MRFYIQPRTVLACPSVLRPPPIGIRGPLNGGLAASGSGSWSPRWGIRHRAVGGRILGLGVAFDRRFKRPVARFVVEMCKDGAEVFTTLRAEGRVEVVGIGP